MKIYFERKIDKLSRIVIPRDIRAIFNINPDDILLFSVEDNKIVIEKK